MLIHFVESLIFQSWNNCAATNNTPPTTTNNNNKTNMVRTTSLFLVAALCLATMGSASAASQLRGGASGSALPHGANKMLQPSNVNEMLGVINQAITCTDKAIEAARGIRTGSHGIVCRKECGANGAGHGLGALGCALCKTRANADLV